MRKNTARIISFLILLALLLMTAGCGVLQKQESVTALPTVPPVQEAAPTGSPDTAPAGAPDTAPTDEPADIPESGTSLPDKDGYYYDPESVVLYLHSYGKLPDNFITKDEARALGWEGGSVERYQKGAAIGGDRFGNREGLLPRADGRNYTECDMNTLGASGRGAERLIFSNDGLYFYTSDHYEHFTELTVTSEGKVEWN